MVSGLHVEETGAQAHLLASCCNAARLVTGLQRAHVATNRNIQSKLLTATISTSKEGVEPQGYWWKG
jgi:hypothetical protein